MNEKFKKSFGDLTVSAGWNGEDLPLIEDLIEPGFLRVTESNSQRVVHERVDMLARRIGWLLSYAERYPEKVSQWNCFRNVRLALGKTHTMVSELLLVERGTRTEDIIGVAKQEGEALVYDWIDSRRTVKTRGPVHTGIILGVDTVKKDAVVFEKEGARPQDFPLIRYWSEVERMQKPITEYVTWAYPEYVLPDPEETRADTREDIDWM